MKYIYTLGFAALVLAILMAFSTMQPGKEKKNDKGNQQQGKSEGKSKEKGNQGRHGNNSRSGESRRGGNHRENQGANPASNNKKDKEGLGNSGGRDKHADKGNFSFKSFKQGKGNSFKLNGKRDMSIDWNLGSFANRYNPRDQKKVTICHKPSFNNSNNGVTINVSENALKMHLNHGDHLGNCKFNYPDTWSSRYIRSREYVFNTYEETWERMSFAEALLSLAANKLLGLRTNLQRDRSTLSPEEIRRRELLIYELENNMILMDDQLVLTRRKLDSDVNIFLNL